MSPIRLCRRGNCLENLGLTVEQNHISSFHALLSQNSCKSLHFHQQLLVRVFFFSVCHWTIPDDSCAVTVPSQHMSIYTIVARRDLAIREPRPVIMNRSRLQRFWHFRQSRAGFLVPVEVRSLFCPKRFGVCEGVTLYFVLWMGRHCVLLWSVYALGILITISKSGLREWKCLFKACSVCRVASGCLVVGGDFKERLSVAVRLEASSN